MASITIRNLDEKVKARLRQRAARNGRSMEAEARAILAGTLGVSERERDLALAIHRRFASLGSDSLPIPPRGRVRTPPIWDE
jgi:plasmid stability protein